jgi:hypothetical protein
MRKHPRIVKLRLVFIRYILEIKVLKNAVRKGGGIRIDKINDWEMEVIFTKAK